MTLCCHLFRPFFKASVFAKLLSSDPYGRISVMHFFNYVMRKVWLHQTRIGLSLYDVAGLGYLRESVCFVLLCDVLTADCRRIFSVHYAHDLLFHCLHTVGLAFSWHVKVEPHHFLYGDLWIIKPTIC